jgi:putative hydrolases of HD superfamily
MLATLIELQRLKRLDRTGWTLRGLAPGSESVAAHTYGVAVVAMLLADESAARGAIIDGELVLRLAVMHDWAEVRVGDMPRTASEYFGHEARRRAESAAFMDITLSLTERVRERYLKLHNAYELRESLESRLVKAADLIDLLIQTLTFERAGARGMDEFWDGVLNSDLKLEGVSGEVVREVLNGLVELRREVFEGRPGFGATADVLY